MRRSEVPGVGVLVCIVTAVAGTTWAAGLALTTEGIVFTDGTVQTTAATSEVAGVFQASGTVTIENGYVGVYGTLIAGVPDGQRALIEHVSIHCSSPVGSEITTTGLFLTSPSGSITRTFPIPVQYSGIDYNGRNVFVGGLMTRLYADRPIGGGGIAGYAQRNSGTGDAWCNLAVNGRLLEIPPAAAGLLVSEAATAPPRELIVSATADGLPPEVQQPPEGAVVKVLAPRKE